MKKAADEIRVGDVVHLKTREDPKMVVDEIASDDKAVCVWIDWSLNTKAFRFDRRSLVKVR